MPEIVYSKDISVIVQGDVCKHTQKGLLSIRRFLPDAEIILSTWEGTQVDGLEYDILLLNPDPRAEVFTKSGTKNNINRQIFSTQNGLKNATRKYALKLRSDCVLKGNKFLTYFGKYTYRNSKCKILKERVLVNTWHTRLPKQPQPLLFHPSDMFMFGLTEDLLNIWDIPLAIEPEHSMYFKNNAPVNSQYYIDGNYVRFFAEMFIWTSFLKKNNIQIEMQDWTDCLSEKMVELSELSIINNLCVLDYKSQFDIVCLKYPKPHYPRVANYHFFDWFNNYEKYCDCFVLRPYEYYISAIYAFFHKIACFLIRNKKKIIRISFKKNEKYLILLGINLYKKTKIN